MWNTHKDEALNVLDQRLEADRKRMERLLEYKRSKCTKVLDARAHDERAERVSEEQRGV